MARSVTQGVERRMLGEDVARYPMEVRIRPYRPSFSYPCLTRVVVVEALVRVVPCFTYSVHTKGGLVFSVFVVIVIGMAAHTRPVA
jgi:hypothetical protein